MSIDPIGALYGALRTVPDFPEPGVQFKDISPILADPALLRTAVRALAAPYADMGVTKVVGVESRGFLFGTPMADWLGAGFVLARKPGKLPAATISEEYTLEYGTDAVEIHIDALTPDDRVLIHDDVIATGGTAAATARLIERVGATVVGFAFLIELEFLNGRTQLPDTLPVHVVLDV
jgi:adenine phosphoribosyltransferase